MTQSTIYSLASNSSGHIFAGTYNGGLFRSTNSGAVWIQTSFPHFLQICSIVVNSTDHIYVGVSTYVVHRSLDNGTSWQMVDQGLAYPYVSSLNIARNGYIYTGTIGGGVYRSILPITSIKDNEGNQPIGFILHQNHPNPFNPTTTIEVSVPQTRYVTLMVFDLLGQEVATLVADELEPGRHKIQWNAAGISSGVYFYRLRAGDVVQTKRLILLR